MRAIVFFSFLFIGASFSHAQGAERHPSGEKAACIASCRDAAEALKDVVALEFSTAVGKKFYVQACNANPKGDALFENDHSTKKSKSERLKAYCDLNPAFRLCFVCDHLKGKKEGRALAASMNACKSLLNEEEAFVFRTGVMGGATQEDGGGDQELEGQGSETVEPSI